jgi:ketosteroid isomerase-like protein
METITHFDSSFVDAFNSGDLKKLENAYHEDAIKAVSRYEMPLVGRESIVQDIWLSVRFAG